MITKEEFENANGIVTQYKKENRLKVGRKKIILSDFMKGMFATNCFLKEKELKYDYLVHRIMVLFGIGKNNAKKIITEMVEQKIITRVRKGIYEKM